MSLVDRTNEEISLSTYWTLDDGVTIHRAQIEVNTDADSSLNPSSWIYIARTDADHDLDMMKLTYAEADLLRDRLSLILGYQ